MYHLLVNKIVFFTIIAPEFNPRFRGDLSWTPGRAQIVSTNDKNVAHKSPFVESVVFDRNGKPKVNLAGWALTDGWRTLDSYYLDEEDEVGLARYYEFLRRTIEGDWAGVRVFSLSEFLDTYGPKAVRELRAKRVEKSTADPFAKFGPKPATTLLADPPPTDHPLPPTDEAIEFAHTIATAPTQKAAAEAAGMSWTKLVKRARELGIDAHAIQGTRAED